MVVERRWPEPYRTKAYELLDRLAGLIDSNNLTVSINGEPYPPPLPAVVNETLPKTESDRESTFALTWAAPGNHGLTFRWMPRQDIIEAILEVSGESRTTVNPTDEWILTTLARFNVKKS